MQAVFYAICRGVAEEPVAKDIRRIDALVITKPDITKKTFTPIKPRAVPFQMH
jgi:hypothetical protein